MCIAEEKSRYNVIRAVLYDIYIDSSKAFTNLN